MIPYTLSNMSQHLYIFLALFRFSSCALCSSWSELACGFVLPIYSLNPQSRNPIGVNEDDECVAEHPVGEKLLTALVVGLSSACLSDLGS